MRIIQTILAALALSYASVSFGSVLNYTSEEYLTQQYTMLKITFQQLNVEKVDKGHAVKISIPSSYGFSTGSDQLKRSMKTTLSELSLFLRSYPESTIEITGHTDNVGNPKSNLLLGEKRANAVATELRKGRVSPLRIETQTEGEYLPLCSNKTLKGRECNRRVEIIVRLESHLEF
ncbi:OmpA family protein [Enterovibrio norvegicus]|uniref:OmpA family protein n=1 Tax=Enterovibrio norvegicus TaxID=188144 RepID=UPI000C8611F8|nr:OmpA family protein [Enterovibrio norvegicus]PMH64427.1 hypothetical protein BCU62_15340 [Enterovibrio norvegicus]